MEIRSHVGGYLIAGIFVLSIWNAYAGFRQNAHWPIFKEDEWTQLERHLVYAKRVLGQLPDQHIEYRMEGASEAYNAGDYHRLQYILAPLILQRDIADNRCVLVEFCSTRTVSPLQNLIFLKDLGYGFGLYRRP